MEPSLEQLRANYSKMPDFKLVRLATYEAADLRPEALEILKAEIAKRGLDLNTENIIKVQTTPLSQEEWESRLNEIRSLPCPGCGSTQYKLNATVTGKVISVILFTHYSKKLQIGCPSCLDKANLNAMVYSGILGWWGVPWGPIQTIRSFILNGKMKQQTQSHEANDIIKAFVINNIGRIEQLRHSPAALLEFISDPE